ncbi:hypothetical protein [uncultured Campylobacter sp.]|uniref:hypothetical protein n=1 Tax=uncultured Campylobacter sp. TaxID=218934 RepID=UPI002630CEDB|nr:hypothetical protein [uncultured Campylobacter sp.]
MATFEKLLHKAYKARTSSIITYIFGQDKYTWREQYMQRKKFQIQPFNNFDKFWI